MSTVTDDLLIPKVTESESQHILKDMETRERKVMKLESSPLSSEAQIKAETERARYFAEAAGDDFAKLRSLSRFMSRQEFAKSQTYVDLIRRTKDVGGSIADCGVFWGGGLFQFANALVTFEPYNYPCTVVGFDTFEGNASLSNKDVRWLHEDYTYKASSFEDLRRAIEIFDLDRPLGHLPKIELVSGDLVDTAPAYTLSHPNVTWRIICLSVNVYEPTVTAIRHFWPRLQKGGALVVHGLGYGSGQGYEAVRAAFGDLGEKPPSFQTHDYWPSSYFAIRD